jgi:MFS family permease
MRAIAAALALTLVVQSLTSMAMIAPSVLAPVAAADLGVAPESIGLFVSGTYLAAMVSGLAAGGLIARFGTVAVCFGALAATALGLALGGGALLAVLPLCALAIGGGYGTVNPVSSHILARAAPPHRMALVFSIKQTGVPIGGAIAGALVPPLLLVAGWRHALLVLAAMCVVPAIVIAMRVRRAPGGVAEGIATPAGAGAVAPPTLGAALRGLGMPIRLAVSLPPLRELSAVSFVFAAMQLALFTYLVSYLNLGLGFTLVAAGLVFAAAQAAGIVGRIVWGALADRLLGPRRMLALLGILMAAASYAASRFHTDWPLAGVVGVAAAFGASAIGWNGVYLAEVARRAPAGQVGTATGGTQFFTFLGALSGPPLFAAAVAAGGGYGSGFAAFALAPLAAALLLIVRMRQ